MFIPAKILIVLLNLKKNNNKSYVKIEIEWF